MYELGKHLGSKSKQVALLPQPRAKESGGGMIGVT